MYKYTIDGVSILTILDTRRSKKSGLYPIKVQVVYNRVQKYYNTGKDLCVEEWESLPNTKTRELVIIRKDMQQSFEKIKLHVLKLLSEGVFTFEALNTQLGKGNTSSVIEAFNHKIENLTIENRIGTKEFYECARNKYVEFAGKDFGFENVTVTWMKKFELYMLEQNRSYTTIGMYGRAMRSLYNDAIKNRAVTSSQYPFGKDKYELPQGEGRKMALTLKQIKDIVSYTDGNEATERYRDLWFFSYLCNGINMIDMLKLQFKDIENDEISFYRSKTIRTSKKKSKIQVVVTPEMKRIIKKWGNESQTPNDYIFPYLKGGESAQEIKKRVADVTKRINLRMKSISEELELPRISTYTARHSFATVLKRSGANIAYISESLGHNDLKTTENYLSSFEREEREKNAKLLTNFDDI